ncbi:MAG: N-acetyl-gamma-glutamyl-phosphate reductase, partial [Chloroflexi bacterium]|nr:N-acetyl-gamma-glutamyl-phosphate reductase [Chloroflexota bacterium]
ILNVTGYAGSELARLLHAHPEVKLTSVTGRSAAGQRLGEFMPHLSDIDLTITAELGDVDVVFSALPHKASAEAVAPLVRQGLKVVDISADFRLPDPVEYKQWYGVDHPATDLLPQAVYGLTELARNEVKKSKLVANPGCYPTGAILALAPAVRAGVIRNDIIVDAKSGVSGAGRGLSMATHFSEVNENVSAYSLNGHRHLPEIVNELGRASAVGKPQVTFIPHLIPMTRGIFSTCYAPLAEGKLPAGDKAKQELVALYRDFYRDEPFIRVVTTPPQTKQTLGNNLCIICPTIDPRTNRLVALSCIDNLVKGAAGQAIQNMNLMLGYPETLGLEAIAVFP